MQWTQKKKKLYISIILNIKNNIPMNAINVQRNQEESNKNWTKERKGWWGKLHKHTHTMVCSLLTMRTGIVSKTQPQRTPTWKRSFCFIFYLSYTSVYIYLLKRPVTFKVCALLLLLLLSYCRRLFYSLSIFLSVFRWIGVPISICLLISCNISLYSFLFFSFFGVAPIAPKTNCVRATRQC